MPPAVGHIEPGSRLCLDAEADSTAAAGQRTEVAVAADQRIEAVVAAVAAAAAAAGAVAGTVRHCSKRGLSQSNEAEVAWGSGTW